MALAAGPGSAYAVVSTRAREKPFRLVRSDGSRATTSARSGCPARDYADVAAGAAGPLTVVARPTTSGYAYESAGLGASEVLGAGTGAPVLALDGTARIAAFTDDDGDAVLSRDGATTILTRTGPALRTTPLDAVVTDGSALVLARVQSRTRSQLRVLGPGAPAAPVASVHGLRPLEATIAHDDAGIYVAYRDGARRLVLATAGPGPSARWSHRRLRVRGTLNGAPAVARLGLRTFVATSQRVRRRYRIFLTTVRPAGAFLDRLDARGRIGPRPAGRDRPGRPCLRGLDPPPGRSRAPRRGVAPSALRRRLAVVGLAPMTELQPDYFERPLAEVDPEVAEAIDHELDRQRSTLEMIASENFVPQAILECQGSVLTNKYAEGYPGKRYYGGCEYVDIIEQLAIDRAKALFGGDHVNVQPHAGAQANTAVYHALLQPGDTILGLSLPHGGHLSHGMKINVSGRLYDIAPYEVSREDHLIDMDEVERIAHERKPKLILAGWSAYPRFLDFERFRAIADAVGAYLMVDMAHFAGLVAADLHPNPVPYADVVTTTIHKTLGGARGGMIICREEHAKKINSAVFPGQQGGPLEHVIAGKAVALKIAQSELFRERQQRTVAGAKAVAAELMQAGNGVNVLTGGTDVHLVLVDLRDSELDGKQAEDRLHEIGITVNRNAVPFDPRPPAVSSGLRVGTSALATRGVGPDEFQEIGRMIGQALQPDFEAVRAELAERVSAIAEGHPLYAQLGTPTAV